jgi:ABC-2 type transport system ATP-binding protein
MKQKIGLVQALQCRPRLAFLDEPTKGLDPLVQQAFYDALTAARAAGMTIFFSSHILSEVERVCDRVAMLRAGALVASGTIESVLASQRRRVRATFTSPIDRSLFAPFGEVLAGESSRIDMLVPRANVPALVRALDALPLVDLTIEPMSLEDAFLEHYR